MPLSGDVIFLRNLTLSAIVGLDAWQRPLKPQPVVIDLKLHTDISAAAAQDAVEQTLNYGTLCKNITRAVEGHETTTDIRGPRAWADLRSLAHMICEVPLRTARETNGITILWIDLTITLPKGVLLAEGGVGLSWIIENTAKMDIEIDEGHPLFFIRQMKIPVIIGVNPHERLDKQMVVIDVVLSDINDHSTVWNCHHDIVREVSKRMEASSFRTLEALALDIARAAFRSPGFTTVTVTVEKPSALTFVAGAGVEFRRTRLQLGLS